MHPLLLSIIRASCSQVHSSKLQSNCWESLEALNSKRESLEKAILSSMRTVERHTMNVASEITYILEHRLEEISTMDELGASVGRAKIAGKLKVTRPVTSS